MDFLNLVRNRQSVRAYNPDRPVEPEKLERCIEAVRLAPSACNAQPWKLIVINDPELKQAVAKAAEAKWLGFNNFPQQAPVLVAIVRENPNLSSKLGTILKDKSYTLMDVGIAAVHFCLQAASEGLGTCMMGWFNEEAVRTLLGVPKNKRIELLITVGYPAKDDIRNKTRKSTDKICSYNKYQ
ncbi:MAG: nitroreductase family protein [Bacteroidota bacterium]|nr:nitroreductase family protein [Bacteroidota bacterium]